MVLGKPAREGESPVWENEEGQAVSKVPREGSEREPETLCLQAVGARKRNRVLFVERSGELPVLARLSDQVVEP